MGLLTPELRALFDPSKETAAEFVARHNIDPNMGYSPEQIESIQNTPLWTNDGIYNPVDNTTYTDVSLTTPASQYTGATTQGVPNLGYASSQLAGTSPAGLEKQNLDYAMAQLGMMTGNYGSGTDNLPGWSAPYGGATADGGYTNPFTGTDSAGRTPDDPYYGGLSDVGTADPNNWSYGNVNDYYNWGGDVLGGMFGPIVGAFGDAAFGINPTPGAGNYIPGTDTYIPTYLENFEGAGEKVTDLYDIGTGDQRDMLIEQGFLGGEGMLGGAVADPDQQFFETKSEALNFYNDGVAVANPGDPGTAEAVGVANDMLSLEGSSFSSQEEAQVVANFGFGSDEHMAVIDSALNGFQAFSSNLEGVPEEEFNRQAQSALKAQQNLTSIMASKTDTAQKQAAASEKAQFLDAVKGYTNDQIAEVNKNLDDNISSLKNTIDNNKDINTIQRGQLEDALYEMTSGKIDIISQELSKVSDTSSKQYSNLLDQLETVEGDLITQIQNFEEGQQLASAAKVTELANKVAEAKAVAAKKAAVEAAAEAARVEEVRLAAIRLEADKKAAADRLAASNYSASDDFGSDNFSGSGGTDVTGATASDYETYDNPDESSGSSGGGGSSSGGGSYIATAATQSLGEEGLTVFNNWRDYMHSWHPTFTTSFGRYRVTAPKIVKAIDSMDNSKELYKEIWDEYLLPIHKLITEKDDTNALVKYKVMVKELMNKYLKGER